MKFFKIGAICVIFVMMLMSISVVYSQDDQAIIAGLLEKRNRLTAEMNAEILVKDAFNKAGTGVSKGACSATECTWTGANGKVLKEIYDGSGNLISDVFTDPEFQMVLTTNYTVNRGIICRTLLNEKEEDKLKLCNPCPMERLENLTIMQDTQQYWAFQDQWVWDLKKNYLLRLKVNCCGVILTQGWCCGNTQKCEI